MENQQNEVFTRVVKAGKRVYYFDVRKTKKDGQLYITITEKKRTDTSSESFKIFLYKEDFEKFIDTLAESIDYAQANDKTGPRVDYRENPPQTEISEPAQL